MPYTQIELAPKTLKFIQASGAYTYVNMFGGRISIDAVGQVVTYTDFKDNIFEFDITLVTSPTFATVGDLAAYLSNNNVYSGISQWYNGDSDPDASFGSNSDYFINRINGDIWHKILGIWTLVNVTGGAGGGIAHATASGTDTYTASITGVSGYNDGDAYLIRFTNGNTTGCTLDINGLGAVDLYRNNDGLLIGGDIWDGAEMLCIYNSTTNGFQCIGTSPNSLYAYVTNADSVTITKGQVVYAFGGTGDRMTVKRAYNTTDSTSAQTIGVVVSSSIATNQKGIIITQGLLDGLSILPTSSFSDGDQLYLGSTPGSITKVKPYAPNHLVYVAVVTTANNGSAGRMYVKVQNGYEMDELHNVQAQSPNNKDVLYYDLASQQWKTNQISGLLGYTPASESTTISTTSPLSGGGNLSANRTLSIQDAAADGTTKGAATFVANDFTSSSGLIGIDYTNGQAATSSVKGFLTSTDWTTFNNKITGIAYKSATNGTAVTGSTANTVSTSQLISAGTFAVGDVIQIVSRVNKTGALGTVTLRIYANTTAVIAGATLIATYLSSTVGNLYLQIERNLFIKSSTNTEVIVATSTILSDTAVTSSVSALNIDWTTNKYIIFALQNGNTGDSTTVSGFKILKV
jgi:hypothetical protein